MKFSFLASNCPGTGYWDSAKSFEVMNSLNIRYVDNAFKLIVPYDFYMLTFRVTWNLKESINSEISYGSEKLGWIYPIGSAANNDYSYSIQAVGGEEIILPWVIPGALSSLMVEVMVMSSDYMSTASGYSYANETDLDGGNSSGGDSSGGEFPEDGDDTGDDNGGNVGGGGITGGDTGDNEGSDDAGNGDGGDNGGSTSKPKFIYPVGTIESEILPASMVGYQGLQTDGGFSHVQIIVAEINADGTVGGLGHVWFSPFYPKDVDMLVTLEALVPMCEGKEITNFNVSYHFVQEYSDGEYDFVDGYIVGGETTVTTFSVQDVEMPFASLEIEDKAYCLDPVLLTVNRQRYREIQYVRIEVGTYIADFEFFADRNLLEIDLAEYLQTVFENVDIFICQQLPTVVLVKMFDIDCNELQKHSFRVECVYGKNPDPILPNCKIRVQWVDKYGKLHDEYFKIVDSVTEGESKQKYNVSREEREDKTGEKSVTVAYIGANAAKKEQLKTIVFADHIRIWIGDTWKRVKVANSYKIGVGREKQNFEFTIKYAL